MIVEGDYRMDKDSMAVWLFAFGGIQSASSVVCAAFSYLTWKNSRGRNQSTPSSGATVKRPVVLWLTGGLLTSGLAMLCFAFYLSLRATHPRLFAALAIGCSAVALFVWVVIAIYPSLSGGSSRPKSEIPKIEDDADVNALNIRITNDIERKGLNDCLLYLHRRVLVGSKARTPLPSFQVIRLTSNHHDIPYMEERRYQLLEFTDPARPFFRSYSGTVDLPCMGLWRLDLELVWYGGQPYRFSKCFMWESGRSPYFTECPTETAGLNGHDADNKSTPT